MNNLLLILAMMVLSNGNVSLFDNKNKSNKSSETTCATTLRSAEVVKEDKITDSTNTANKRSGPRIKKIKKIKKRSKPRESTNSTENGFSENSTRSGNKRKGQGLKFDMGDVNKGIKLLDLSEEELDRGMEIIIRTKKYMNRDERNILIKLESILDLVKGIKKLNDINILSDQEESDFFRSMEEEDKKNMMIKEILEVFPEDKKQSVEKALDMKKKIDLFAELFLPDTEDGSGFSLSSLADFSNLGSISNLKMLSSLLRGFDNNDADEDEDEIEDEYVSVENNEDDNTEYEYVEYEAVEDSDYDEYLEVKKAVSNNKKYSKSKAKNNPNRRRKTSSKSN